MFFHGKRVLVTGAGGLVGGHLIQALHARGAKVRAAFRTRRPPLIDGVDYFMGADLTRREVVDEAVKDIELIFHCAASTSGAAAMNATPLVHVTPNIVMNAQLFEAAYFAGVQKLLYLGSMTGYPPTGKPYKEEEMFAGGDPWDKYFPVGWMKRYSEVLCRLYSERLPRKMPCLVLRPTNIYGPGDKFDPERSHFLPALIRRVVERQDPMLVWGSGEEVRDLIFVDDMVDAMLLGMERLNGYDPVNIGSGDPHTIKQVLGLILKIEGREATKVEFDPTKPTTIPVQLADVTKAERLIGFKAKVGLEEGIRQTIAWYRSRVLSA